MVSDWMKKTPEQKARYVANARAKRAVKAVAEGRVPGKTGTPKRLVTEELKEAARIKRNKRNSKNSLKYRTAKRAAKAIAEGRTPGKVGGPKLYDDVELAVRRKSNLKRSRQNNLEERKLYERAASHKRRAQKRGNGGMHTKEDIKALYFEQKGLCGLCDLHMSQNGYHVDHWKPLSKGGSNDKSNLKLLHPSRNMKKSNKLPEELKFNIRKTNHVFR